MNSIEKFFDNNSIRFIITETNDIWAVGKDIAQTLGYLEPHKAIQKHVDEDDKKEFCNFESSTGQIIPSHLQATTILINESGIYSLILRSKLPASKNFKRWVTSEVLPELRKTGKYEVKVDNFDNELKLETLKEKRVELESLNRLSDMYPDDILVKTMYKDYVSNKVCGYGNHRQIQFHVEKFYGAVDIAMKMGYTVKDFGNGCALGKYVASRYRSIKGNNIEHVDLLCNSKIRPVNQYPEKDVPEIENFIKEFMDA